MSSSVAIFKLRNGELFHHRLEFQARSQGMKMDEVRTHVETRVLQPKNITPQDRNQCVTTEHHIRMHTYHLFRTFRGRFVRDKLWARFDALYETPEKPSQKFGFEIRLSFSDLVQARAKSNPKPFLIPPPRASIELKSYLNPTGSCSSASLAFVFAFGSSSFESLTVEITYYSSSSSQRG